MREIKFRAWDKDESIMTYLDLGNKNPDISRLHIAILSDHLREVWGEVMQFTGLKDKNGKEIYEGDIVRRDGWLYEIRWSFVSAGFDLSTKRDSYPQQEDGYAYHSGLYDTEIIEIIGNIYENPELAGGTTKGLDCEG